MSISIGTPTTHHIRHIPSDIINIVEDLELDRLNLPYIWVSNYWILIFNIEDYFSIGDREFDNNQYRPRGVREQDVISMVNLMLLNASEVILL